MAPHDLANESEPAPSRPLRRPPKEDLSLIGPTVDFSERHLRARALRLSPAISVIAAVDRGISGRVIDVSVTGLVIEHGQPLRPGMTYTLSVTRGETKHWIFRAQVARSQVVGSATMLGVRELLYRTAFAFLEGLAEEMWEALSHSPGGSLREGDCVMGED